MPKKVDQLQRRTQIADALMQVAGQQGLEAVSMRHVAETAGVSVGMVQHYFRNKDELMTFAMSVVRDRSQARLTAAIEGLGDDPPPRQIVRTFLTTMLPLNEQSTADGRVALAFLAYRAGRPSTTPALRDETSHLVAFLADRLGGPAAADAASGLLALMEGLGLYLLGGQYTPEQALAALDAQLDWLFNERALQPGAELRG